MNLGLTINPIRTYSKKSEATFIAILVNAVAVAKNVLRDGFSFYLMNLLYTFIMIRKERDGLLIRNRRVSG